MAEPIIELDGISFSYNGELALNNISFAVEAGNYDGIIGPNGSGKTTLLKIILGLLTPQSGQVRLFGKDIHEFRDWSRIGYLPQKVTQADVRFPITVNEVVAQGRIAKAGLFKRLGASDVAPIQRAMELADVMHLKDRLIADLSGGERQRVFIARALASEPDVLLLDEPVTGVDIASQGKFYRFLRKLNTEHGLTILFVSHDIEVLGHEATRLICINRRLVCDGPASFVFRENQNLLQELYGESVRVIFRNVEG
ncbi:MAG TPA: metal ABC transporter ATP-binding protein [Anaerolineae bacterium]|nr:metal ABC transporter ATP-binding protein [Anaerolineae bacterium]